MSSSTPSGSPLSIGDLTQRDIAWLRRIPLQALLLNDAVHSLAKQTQDLQQELSAVRVQLIDALQQRVDSAPSSADISSSSPSIQHAVDPTAAEIRKVVMRVRNDANASAKVLFSRGDLYQEDPMGVLADDRSDKSHPPLKHILRTEDGQPTNARRISLIKASMRAIRNKIRGWPISEKDRSDDRMNFKWHKARHGGKIDALLVEEESKFVELALGEGHWKGYEVLKNMMRRELTVGDRRKGRLPPSDEDDEDEPEGDHRQAPSAPSTRPIFRPQRVASANEVRTERERTRASITGPGEQDDSDGDDLPPMKEITAQVNARREAKNRSLADEDEVQNILDEETNFNNNFDDYDDDSVDYGGPSSIIAPPPLAPQPGRGPVASLPSDPQPVSSSPVEEPTETNIGQFKAAEDIRFEDKASAILDALDNMPQVQLPQDQHKSISAILRSVESVEQGRGPHFILERHEAPLVPGKHDSVVMWNWVSSIRDARTPAKDASDYGGNFGIKQFRRGDGAIDWEEGIMRWSVMVDSILTINLIGAMLRILAMAREQAGYGRPTLMETQVIPTVAKGLMHAWTQGEKDEALFQEQRRKNRQKELQEARNGKRKADDFEEEGAAGSEKDQVKDATEPQDAPGPKKFYKHFQVHVHPRSFKPDLKRERNSRLEHCWSLKVPQLKALHKLPGVPKYPGKKTDSISTLLDFGIKVKDVEQLKNDSKTEDGADKDKEGTRSKGTASK
ncbi:hypothetical protein CF319_g7744 [Tilletia indica]|nr:hypothetical protein CF319_g7744 [Tilletia indica]